MKTVLCIGGLDPAGRAGLLVDAATVRALGARPLCVASALTFQSSKRMVGYEAVSVHALKAQLAMLKLDEQIDAVKIGQIGSGENAEVVANWCPRVPVVLDTPLVSSTGGILYPADELDQLTQLIDRATVVTPNFSEADVLGDLLEHAKAILLKGGHIPGDEVEDVLTIEGERRNYRSPRIPGSFRGTGCRLASAIAVRLAHGDALCDAVEAARNWLQGELKKES